MKVLEVAVLAIKDVLHEWRMSFCVMFAVAAIAIPLLLFFGLKSGVMNTLENRLLNNPATVELISMSDRKLDDKWFAEHSADSRVAFVIPRTRRLAASAEFSKASAGSKKGKSLDLYPSALGDPLMDFYGQKAPLENECVLSSEAMRRTGAQVGDRVLAVISRDRGTSRAEREFTVVGVLPEAAGTVAAAYITLEELEEIEAFKDGIAVPKRNWPGADNTAYPVTPRVLIALPDYLDAVREAMLIQNTGFSKLEKLDEEGLKKLQPFISDGLKGYLVSTVGNPAGKKEFLSLADRFRGRSDAIIVPFNDELELRISDRTFRARALKAYKGVLNEKLQPMDTTDFSDTPAVRELYLSKRYEESLGKLPLSCEAVIREKGDDEQYPERKVVFDARVKFIDDLDENTALLPMSLLTQLGLLKVRELQDGLSNKGEPAFMLKKRGYTGFRMYADSLENVISLKESLMQEGIKTSSRADRISEVLSLDRYLSLLFLLIACASILGAVCCLVANVYANVERKRKELAILRLLGVNSLELGIFPLVGSITLTLGGIIVSLIVFYILMYVINSMFSYQLSGDEKFCDLSFYQAVNTVMIACAIASFSGIMASRRIMKIEPSESLRDE